MTMNTNRRQLLKRAVLVPMALVLAKCAPATTTATGTTTLAPTISLSSALQGIEAIGSTIAQDIPALSAAGLTGAAATTVSTIIGDIQSVASTISTASTLTAGQGVLAKIEGYINQLAPIVTPFLSLIPGAGSIIALAVAALPAIEGGLNVAVSLLTPAATALATPPAPAAGPGAPPPAQAALALLISRAGGK